MVDEKQEIRMRNKVGEIISRGRYAGCYKSHGWLYNFLNILALKLLKFHLISCFNITLSLFFKPLPQTDTWGRRVQFGRALMWVSGAFCGVCSWVRIVAQCVAANHVLTTAATTTTNNAHASKALSHALFWVFYMY